MIQSPVQASQVYTDINGLQSIRALGKQDKSAAMMEVAKQFESMFIGMMMKSMRDASAVFEEDSLMNSPESDFYRQMYDSQMSVTLAGSGSAGRGMGLAEAMHRQLMSAYGDEKSAKVELDQSQLFSRRVATPPAYKRLQETMQEVDEVLSANANKPAVDDVKTPTPAQDIASGRGGKGQQFATPYEFVAALYPEAQKIAAEIGVDAKAIVAQAALETGWGKHMITDDKGRNSFNFFGIKADHRWSGSKVDVLTHEYRDGVAMKERAPFRSYASLEEGLRDYADFLRAGSRYQHAINQDLTAEHYGHALQKAGYATDPQYGAKIHRIAQGETLINALQSIPQPVQSGAGSNE